MMTFLSFFFFLSLLIFFHELGHFLGAKKVGVVVEEFSLGFPPRIFSKKIKDTIYSLGIIFFGGFVKLKGENDPSDPFGFLNVKASKRLIVVLAGVFFNIILAYLLIALSLNLGYPFESNKIFVSGFVSKNSQAVKFFERGDEILEVKVNNKVYKFENLERLSSFLRENRGKQVEIVFLRDNQKFSVEVVPPVGFYLANFQLKKIPLPYNFLVASEETLKVLKKIIMGLGQVVKSFFSEEKVNLEIIGPVGIYNLFNNFRDFGLGYLFYFLAVLSLNLALINALPFPALDGGRALFIFLEILRGKRLSYRKEELIHRLGFILLFSLLIVITLKDINKLWLK